MAARVDSQTAGTLHSVLFNKNRLFDTVAFVHVSRADYKREWGIKFIRHHPVRGVTQHSGQKSWSSEIKIGKTLILKKEGNGAPPVSSGICLPMRLGAQSLIEIPMNLQNQALIITPTAQRKEDSLVVCCVFFIVVKCASNVFFFIILP